MHACRGQLSTIGDALGGGGSGLAATCAWKLAGDNHDRLAAERCLVGSRFRMTESSGSISRLARNLDHWEGKRTSCSQRASGELAANDQPGVAGDGAQEPAGF